MSHPVDMYTGTPIDILFDIIKTIVSFNNLASIKPILYRRLYSNGYYNDPDYMPVCAIGQAQPLTLWENTL